MQTPNIIKASSVALVAIISLTPAFAEGDNGKELKGNELSQSPAGFVQNEGQV